MIAGTNYKNRPALEIKSDGLCALFLPEDGGKMASLKNAAGFEFLLQAEGSEYKVLNYDGRYGACECSGFDDMFPTIDPYTPESGAFAGMTYPDHGEVCRMPSDYTVYEDRVTFTFRSRIFQTVFSKTVRAEGEAIVLHYQIENHADEDFPYIWAAHCMLSGDPDAEIITPYGPDAPIRKMFGKQEAAGMNRKSLSPYSADGDTYKFYYLDRIQKGFCGYRYPSQGQTLMFRYDAEKIPYLGLWLNNGSCKGMYNIALEPCTAPFDSPGEAQKCHAQSIIKAHGSFEFTLRITCESI